MVILGLFYAFLFVGVIALGAFFWGFLFMVFISSLLLCAWVSSELGGSRFISRYPVSFWLFILGELAIFITLFSVAIWADDGDSSIISDWMELPFLGSFFLLSSSLSATTLHYCGGITRFGRVLIIITIFWGLCFIALQGKEFYDCDCDLFGCTYVASSFCTVGLHFTHVLIGLLGFLSLAFYSFAWWDFIYLEYAVWYWHFVDYIWLLVFFFIYFP